MPPRQRQIHDMPSISTVNASRDRPARRAGSCGARTADGDVDRSLVAARFVNNEARRDERGRSNYLIHGADSLKKPEPFSRSTASKVSQTPNCTPKHTAAACAKYGPVPEPTRKGRHFRVASRCCIAMIRRLPEAERPLASRSGLRRVSQDWARAIADADNARGKLAPYVMKRQIGRRGDAGEQPGSLAFEMRGSSG